MSDLKPLDPIPFKLGKDFYPSTWSFDPCFIRAGEEAHIVGYWFAHATNPLYHVRNAAGNEKAIHRSLLLDHGAEFHPVSPVSAAMKEYPESEMQRMVDVWIQEGKNPKVEIRKVHWY